MTSLKAGSVIAGKYRLERLLAKGGMGAVWVARHIQLDLVVAIKFIEGADASSGEARVRFDREAKASARLKSPHVVHVYDYGIENDMPYLAMELLSGEDLESKLKREGRLSPAVTSGILTQLCKGLRVAHDAGLVHRDLKPGNIFLTKDHEGEELAKILDFGIAKAVAAGVTKDATETGAIIGSPRYMSPEQVRNAKRVDHRSDLWSMAVILFRCVTGRAPFHGNEIASLILQICAEPIPAPSELAPELNASMDRFFAKALARSPEERFQSARELADAFAEVAGTRLPSADWSRERARDRSPFSPVPRAENTPAGSAPTYSTSISELPTVVRGAITADPRLPAPAITNSHGGGSDGTLSPATPTSTGQPRAGGTPAILWIAAAAILAVIGVAGAALVRGKVADPSAAEADRSAPQATLIAPAGAQPPASPGAVSASGAASAPEVTPSPNASAGATPSATPSAKAPASIQAPIDGGNRNRSRPGAPAPPNSPSPNPPLGF